MSDAAIIDPSRITVGELARRFPAATRVLERLRIDYCCGGDRSLVRACADAGVSAAEVVAEVVREATGGAEEAIDWEGRPLGELCRHIVLRYHEPLKRELAILRPLAVRVAVAHGEREPRLVELAELVGEFADDMEAHMEKEERVLFPLISAGGGPFVSQPVAVMRREHAEHGERMARMAALTDGFTAPEDGCGSWHALAERLRELDGEIRAHMHLENNVLFPRAVAENGAGAPAV